MMNKKQIIFGIALVVIIVGIVMQLTLGFNTSFDNGTYTRINVYMTKQVELDEVKTLVGEIFNGKCEVEYTDEFSDTISIKATGMSDEQIQEIQNKLKEKYEFEEGANHIVIMTIPTIRVYDLIREYIMPILLSFVIVIVYFAIAFRKLGIYKSLIEPIISVILIGGVYVSILAICRIPINEYVIPLGIFIYITSLLGFAMCLNKQGRELVIKKK